MKYATAFFATGDEGGPARPEANGDQKASEKLDEAGEEHQREKRRGASIFSTT